MRKFVDEILASLWFRPGLWMLVYAVVAVSLVKVDEALYAADISVAIPGVLESETDGAQTMLGAIASAMLTVTSLAFSLMMVSVVQMANAYSPRLLRQYIADTHNQNVLGILLGTFLYSLLVLRSVSAASDAPLVLATNGAVGLSLVATIALVYFLNHVAQSIKVSSIIRMIIAQTKDEIERGFPRNVGQPWRPEGKDGPKRPSLPELAPTLVYADSSGYVQRFVVEPLLAACQDADLTVRMHWAMGDYVLAGTPIASIWASTDEGEGEGAGEELEEAVITEVRAACVLGPERTFAQDVRFGLQQLTDIALRALSPGINDPSTAGSAIDALTFLLGKNVKREPASRYRCDADGRLRIVFPRCSLEGLIEDSYLRILQYGGADVQVMRRLLYASEQLSTIAKHRSQRDAIWAFVEAVNLEADKRVELPSQRRSLDAHFEGTRKRLDRPPLPSLIHEPA